jgi:hypothetical protein
MPADMSRYPEGWKEFSGMIRFGRAGGRCECTGSCGLHKTHPGPRRCTEIHGTMAQYAKGKVILTVAHLCNCEPPCAIPEHVQAQCQRCHLRFDVKLHVEHRYLNRRIKQEQGGQIPLLSR